jgi:predicted permease
MFENFMTALRVVLPLTFLMGIGILVRKAKVVDRPSMRKVDNLCFRLFMPTLLFKSIYESDLLHSVNGRGFLYVLICMLVIFFVMGIFLPRKLLADGGSAATVGQALIRPNYILFGIAVAESIFGEGGTGTVALFGALIVPMINVFSTLILELNRSGSADLKKLFLSVLKNPLIVATLLALVVITLHIQIPDLLYSVIKNVANVTTTIAFISLGVSLDLGQTLSNRRTLILVVLTRMVLLPLIFLPLSIALGFRDGTLCALMIFFAAPTAVSSYPMAVAMGADGPLAGQLVCCTTVTSIFTIFCWTLLLRTLGVM